MAVEALTAESFGYHPSAPSVIADRHRYYRTLRDEAPVLWSEELGGWMITRYEDVKSILREPERFSSVKKSGRRVAAQQPREGVAGYDAPTLLSQDRPDHTRLRKLLDSHFTPKAIYALEPHVQDVVDELLAPAAESGELDVMSELAVPLPVIVIAELLGIPPDERETFKRWSSATTDQSNPKNAEEAQYRSDQIAEFRTYLLEQIEERREDPSEHFIGRLVTARESDGDDALSERELLAFIGLLLIAGNETTTDLIGSGTLALLRHPDQRRLLQEQPELIEPAIEELLRYDGPIQQTSRVVTEDVTIRGVDLPALEIVLPVLASANRDERQFADPDRLDIQRKPNRHVAFGDWIHICIGQWIARLEARVAIPSLLRVLPDIELAIGDDEVEYRENRNRRGLAALPVRDASRSA